MDVLPWKEQYGTFPDKIKTIPTPGDVDKELAPPIDAGSKQPAPTPSDRCTQSVPSIDVGSKQPAPAPGDGCTQSVPPIDAGSKHPAPTPGDGCTQSVPSIDVGSKQPAPAHGDGCTQSVPSIDAESKHPAPTPGAGGTTTLNIRDSKTVSTADGGWGWIVTFASLFVSLVVDGVNGVSGIFYKEFLNTFGGSKGKTQTTFSVMFGTLLFLGPLTGVVVRKYGSRRVAICGGLIASSGFFLSTFSPSLDVMILLYGFVGGFGFALLYSNSLVTVGMYFEKRRALATGIAVSGSGVGVLVMAPMIELLLEIYGWKGTIWIMSAFVLNTVVCGALYRPASSRQSILLKLNKSSEDSTITSKKNSINIRRCCGLLDIFELSLLKRPVLLIQICWCFLNMMGYNIPFGYLPVHSVSVGLSSRESALLISIIGISSIVSRVLVGYISDKSCVNTFVLNSVMLLIGALSTSLVPYYTTFASLALYSIVYGATTATFATLMTVNLVKMIGVQFLSATLGIQLFCNGSGSFIGPPIAGVLSEMTGSYNSVFYFGGAVIGLAGFLSLPLICMARRQEEQQMTVEINQRYSTADTISNVSLKSFRSTSDTLP
ncbi:monocarboxylate transporter 12-like [Argopecten irradians]|uniref:monocarboxylate transporter 12-like n=1 Tax=Argopecten irradians TaxID=31199 RepID=UPI00371E64F4